MWPAGAAAEELQSDYDEDFDHPWTCKLPGESPPVLEARRWKRLHEKKSEAPSGFTKYDRCQHEWAQSEYDKEVSGVPEEVLDNANNPECVGDFTADEAEEIDKEAIRAEARVLIQERYARKKLEMEKLEKKRRANAVKKKASGLRRRSKRMSNDELNERYKRHPPVSGRRGAKPMRFQTEEGRWEMVQKDTDSSSSGDRPLCRDAILSEDEPMSRLVAEMKKERAGATRWRWTRASRKHVMHLLLKKHIRRQRMMLEPAG